MQPCSILSAAALIAVSARCSTAADPPLTAGAWTLVHIPDTQNYVVSAARAEILTEQIGWITANKTGRNIRFAVQVGDLVNDNGDDQWDRARESFGMLFGQVPVALCSGNHDCGPGGSGDSRASQFALDTRFGIASPYWQQPSVGGYFRHPDDPPGNTQNSWHTFRAGSRDFLVLTCEWGPRDKVVAWMNGIVSARPSHRVILVCHAYLASGSTRFDWQADPSGMNPRGTGLADDPDGVNDGEDLWQKLVKNHENFCLVSCGHAGRGFRTVTGIHGNRVHEMLYNTQDLANGGDGWLRLLEFFPDGRTVRARTYSTLRSEWDQSAAASFTFKLSPVSRADADSDGLPDYYEAQHDMDPADPSDAIADADHDGSSNSQEFLACTSPLDGRSLLQISSLSSASGETVSLEWTSVAGLTYQVQQSDSPGGSDWSNVGTPVTAAASVSATAVPKSGSRQFLRVTVVED